MNTISITSRDVRLPKVSVVVTGYNSAATIARAIDSAREQTLRDLEIVVVDDASSDDTAAVAEAIPDTRIRIVRNRANRGIGGAKNVGVEAARGEYIAFLDSDDTWVPHKLEAQLAALAVDPAASPLAFSAFWVHRADTGTTVVRQPKRYGTWLKSVLTGETFSLGSTLLATKACFDAVGPFDDKLTRLQDRDWTLRYLRQWNEFALIDEPLAHIFNSGWPKPETVERSVNDLYRVHEDDLRAREPALADLFRASLDFEVAVYEYRSGRAGAATRRIARTLAECPAYSGYLAGRLVRKLVQRDLT